MTLTLCDLAGFEDPRLTGARGERLREGGATNTSLGVLRRVLGALKKGGTPPWRESALSRLLGVALGPPSLVLLLLALNPHSREERGAGEALSFACAVRGGPRNWAAAPPPAAPPPPLRHRSVLQWLHGGQQTLTRLKRRRPPSSPPPPPPDCAPPPLSVLQLQRCHGRPHWLPAEHVTRAVLRALNGDPAELRGVGPRGALRIRQWRDTNGAFRTVEELTAVPGFSVQRVAALLQANISAALGSPNPQ